MHIPEEKIEEVRLASDIVDVVSDYVHLKKSGSNLFGLCPFHNEKTPSFSVNPGMSIFKCFGCGAGGDVFQFVMRVEHLAFPEAVRLLADQAGIDLPEEGRGGDDQNETERILFAIRYAARFFYRSLTESEDGKPALEYLLGRGITSASIKKFGIGWAPDAWDGLLKNAVSGHVDAQTLEQAGLAIPRKSGDGYYDRFRGRVMFPIFSHVGKVVGFGGRILEADSDQPKYINTPETRVYHKSDVLYGLYQARRAIREQRSVYIVEGYTDVIALHQNGIENAVAACGTSLTPEHLRLVNRYADAVIFLNDSDTAGEASNSRSIDLALKQGLTPYVVELPPGEDPASFAETRSPEQIRDYLGHPKHKWTFVQFLLIRARRDGLLESVEGERQAFEEVLERVGWVESRFTQETYLQQMAEALGKPLVHLHEEFRRVSGRSRRRQAHDRRRDPQPPPAADRRSPVGEQDAAPAPSEPDRVLPEEGALLRLMLERGASLVEFVLGNMAVDEFSEGLVRRIVGHLVRQYETATVDPQPFVDGTFGLDVQDLVAGLMVDRHEPSENWQRLKNIPVPRMNEDPFESAASAMTLLKLDRVDESIGRTKRRHDERLAAGEDVRGDLEELMALKKLRRQIERREYLDWNEA